MQRTTVMIPKELKAQAVRCAEMTGVSLGQLIRDSLQKEIEHAQTQVHSQDSFFEDKEIYEGEAPLDSSVDHDNYIY
ncbi:MAG: hypothetical protein ABR542_07625 [Desulfonatronovibrio sp.]|nr:hypothetical protein [Desulfovibrionales bacterium]